MTTVLIHIDPVRCVHSLNCSEVAPAVFVYDRARGAVQVVEHAIELTDRVRAAVEGCPVAAITLRDPLTGEGRQP